MLLPPDPYPLTPTSCPYLLADEGLLSAVSWGVWGMAYGVWGVALETLRV